MFDYRSGTTGTTWEVCSCATSTAATCWNCGVFIVRSSLNDRATFVSVFTFTQVRARRLAGHMLRRESWTDAIRLRAHAWTPPPRPSPSQARRRPLHGVNPHQAMRWKRRRFIQAIRAAIALPTTT